MSSHRPGTHVLVCLPGRRAGKGGSCWWLGTHHSSPPAWSCSGSCFPLPTVCGVTPGMLDTPLQLHKALGPSWWRSILGDPPPAPSSPQPGQAESGEEGAGSPRNGCWCAKFTRAEQEAEKRGWEQPLHSFPAGQP